jgi:glyoxylase-like metal-dependent hydrolase (beta-lactamase superfamily II)
MELIIKKIVVGKWKVNCYLIASGNVGWIIDPGDETENIIDDLNLDAFELKGIINTHGHFDHIGAVAAIKEKYKIPFFIHSKDKRIVTQGNLYRRMVGDNTVVLTPLIDDYLDDLIPLELMDKKILTHYIPGHSTGSVCFEIEGNLFCGDIFFGNNIGRTDLPGGNKDSLVASVNYIFDKFIGFYVHPGHGESFILDKPLIEKLKLKI